MSSNEKKILSILNGGKTSLSIKELSRKMNVDIIELMEAINNLMETDKIFRDPEGKYYALAKNTYVTKIELSKKGFPYVMINERFFYVKKGELNSANLDDKVLVKVLSGEKPKVEVIEVLERKISEVVCEVSEKDGVKTLIPFKPVEKYNIQIGSKINQLVDGQRILVELSTKKYDGAYNAKFIRVIGHKNEPGIDIISIALNNGFDTEFSEEELKQAEEIPTEVREEDIINRIDLRDEKVFTIDGNDTKDIDDAISIRLKENGNILLRVHIAAPSYYIKPNTPLFNGAIKRGTSVYPPGCVIPLFPFKLSNGICSLSPKVDRISRTIEMEYDESGKIVRSRVYPSVINSKKQMTYEELNKIFETGEYTEEYKEFENDVELARRLNRMLKRKREKQRLKFCNIETKFHIDEDGNVVDMYPRACKEAENIIENFMIEANETMAKYAAWCDLNFIYRVHDAPSKEKINETIDFLIEIGYKLKRVQNVNCPTSIQRILEVLSDKKEFPILSQLLLKSMKKAEYCVDNKGHYALGINEYGHTTSPIRRTPDYIIHTLFDYLDNLEVDTEEFKALESRLSEICRISSEQERNADQVEREANYIKSLEYAEKNIGLETEGYVEFMGDKVLYIRTVEGLLGSLRVSRNEQKKYKIGDEISVRIQSVSREKMKMYFEKIQKTLKDRSYVLS